MSIGEQVGPGSRSSPTAPPPDFLHSGVFRRPPVRPPVDARASSCDAPPTPMTPPLGAVRRLVDGILPTRVQAWGTNGWGGGIVLYSSAKTSIFFPPTVCVGGNCCRAYLNGCPPSGRFEKQNVNTHEQ